VKPQLGQGSSTSWALGCSCGLVVTVGAQDKFAHEFARVGVHDADVEVLDEKEDLGPCVDPADADVAEPAINAQGSYVLT
jgi:hypothetical protein